MTESVALGGKPHHQRTRITPETIDWGNAVLLTTAGAYGLVYRIAEGLVAKVGLIEPQEVKLQQRLADLGKALPVLAYAECVSLPFKISEAFCARHGLRVLAEDMVICCCDMPLAVLVMPEADTAIWDNEYDSLEIAEFIEEIDTFCLEELGHNWDAEERNLAIYQRHLVALDFGDPDANCY
jgi:hypothetical protein